MENLLAVAPDFTEAGFFRTAGGAEVDLVLDLPAGERWAIEVKWARSPRPARGFHIAREVLRPDRSFLVGGGNQQYPAGRGVEGIGVRELAEELASRSP